MNTIAFHPESQPLQLVDYVDFKWLMASVGHRIDVARLQSDAAYAEMCMGWALASPSAVLHRLAKRLCQGAVVQR